jgi:hypothetical protein
MATVGTWWVKWVYIWMIVAVIGGMLLHNLLAWRRAALHVRKHQSRPVVRMTPNQRLQHATLVISFLVLVWTGFALKFPDGWLAFTLGGSEQVRRVTHRLAALVMVAASLYHVIYAVATREGRRLVLDFLPTLQDVRDVMTNLKYLAGLSDQRPRFGRFGYPEKGGVPGSGVGHDRDGVDGVHGLVLGGHHVVPPRWPWTWRSRSTTTRPSWPRSPSWSGTSTS